MYDSSTWGNHSDSSGAAEANSGEKRATGFSEAWKANNIYDLAGNVLDWTIEAFNTGRRVSRGGRYSSAGAYGPAYYRTQSSPSATSNGARLALYVALDTE